MKMEEGRVRNGKEPLDASSYGGQGWQRGWDDSHEWPPLTIKTAESERKLEEKKGDWDVVED